MDYTDNDDLVTFRGEGQFAGDSRITWQCPKKQLNRLLGLYESSASDEFLLLGKRSRASNLSKFTSINFLSMKVAHGGGAEFVARDMAGQIAFTLVLSEGQRSRIADSLRVASEPIREALSATKLADLVEALPLSTPAQAATAPDEEASPVESMESARDAPVQAPPIETGLKEDVIGAIRHLVQTGKVQLPKRGAGFAVTMAGDSLDLVGAAESKIPSFGDVGI